MLEWIESYEHALEDLELYYQLVGVKYNDVSGLYDIYAQGVKVSSTGTIEAARKSLDFYENVYYNPLYNDQFGLRRG